MKALATCFGAGTIVNAIATRKGAAFGLALRATAVAESSPKAGGVRAQVTGPWARGQETARSGIARDELRGWRGLPQASPRLEREIPDLVAQPARAAGVTPTPASSGTPHRQRLDRMPWTRRLRISAANIGPTRFHQNRTVSWQKSMPRSCSRSSTLCSDKGNRTYNGPACAKSPTPATGSHRRSSSIPSGSTSGSR